MGRFSSRVIAITGASSGIGRACADRLADEGAAVVVSARRTERLQELAAAITARGGRALAHTADVTSAADMDALVGAAVATFGHLDVMICNAGIGYHGLLDEMTPDTMRQVVDVNLMGTLYAARAALAVFRRQRAGHLLAISSIVGRRGIARSGVYSATKAAQVALVESIRTEFVGTGCHASVVLPVSTYTEFHDAVERNFGYRISRVGPRQSADDVARAVADCIARPKAEVYPHRLSRGLGILNVLAPSLTDRFVRRYRR
jgi:NADP-dependent 3-hydroxy acid dehydrogenase YdfG